MNLKWRIFMLAWFFQVARSFSMQKKNVSQQIVLNNWSFLSIKTNETDNEIFRMFWVYFIGKFLQNIETHFNDGATPSWGPRSRTTATGIKIRRLARHRKASRRWNGKNAHRELHGICKLRDYRGPRFEVTDLKIQRQRAPTHFWLCKLHRITVNARQPFFKSSWSDHITSISNVVAIGRVLIKREWSSGTVSAVQSKKC